MRAVGWCTPHQCFPFGPPGVTRSLEPQGAKVEGVDDWVPETRFELAKRGLGNLAPIHRLGHEGWRRIENGLLACFHTPTGTYGVRPGLEPGLPLTKKVNRTTGVSLRGVFPVSNRAYGVVLRAPAPVATRRTYAQDTRVAREAKQRDRYSARYTISIWSRDRIPRT